MCSANQICAGLFILLCVTISACSAPRRDERNLSQEIDAVADCLNRYKAGVEAGDLAANASCQVPPLDEWQLAVSAQTRANQGFVDALVDVGALDAEPDRIKAIRDRMNPAAGISRYEFSNIRIDGHHATAEVTMTVNGEEKSSIQKLVQISDKWFIGNSDKHTEADARELRKTAEVTNAYAKAVWDLIERVKTGAVAGPDAQDAHLKMTHDLQAKIVEIQAKNPKSGMEFPKNEIE
jgi:hypothetical protein